ncbi:replication initiation protein RepC [Bartonella rochalimae]|uniref:replication initiation protein RepC n=1 Tax=Bartonella rochalimae TaxID=395923 RepID=UPI003F686530
MAYEKKRKAKTKLYFLQTTAHCLKLSHICGSELSLIPPVLDNRLTSVRDLIGSVGFLAKIMGISPSAVEEAKNTMGLEKTAFAMGIILEKQHRQLVISPGGYLRGIIAKEKRDELHLERSFYALLKENDTEKLNEKCIEKKNKKTPKNEEFHAFKSELNKVLKTFKMPEAKEV